MRLYDWILRNSLPVLRTDICEPRSWDAFRQQIKKVQCIVSDNVTEYFYAGTQQDIWSYDDFPNVAPPFEHFFMEAKRPSRIGSATGQQTDVRKGPEFWGALFDAVSVANGRTDDSTFNRFPEFQKKKSDLGDGWMVVTTPVSMSGGAIVYYGMHPIFFIDAAGHIKSSPLIVVECDRLNPAYEADVKRFVEILDQFLLALCFLHCKNVGRAVVEPPKKLARAIQRRHGIGPTKYTVLQIDAMRRVLSNAATENGCSGLKPSLHICRGHFKTYDERPLFGSIKGTFWWDAHVRGDAAVGTVEKTYDVKAHDRRADA